MSNPSQLKSLVGGVVAFVLALVPLAAYAQSAATTPVTITPPNVTFRGAPVEWTGFHFGATINFVSANADTTFDGLPNAVAFVNLAPTTLSPDMPHSSFTFHGGLDRPMRNVIVGVEGDFTMGSPDGFTFLTPFIQNNGTPFQGTLYAGEFTDWLITVRGRVGRDYGRIFVYGTAGVAFASVEYTAEADFSPQGNLTYPVEFSKTKVGWTAGGGVEYRVTEHMSARAEYRLVNLGTESANADPVPAHPPFQIANTWQTRSSNICAGVVLRFK